MIKNIISGMKHFLLILVVCLSMAACVKETPMPADVVSSSVYSIDDRIDLIISHDGAPDDITATAYLAKHPEINIIGVVNSYGEQHPSKSMDEWQRFLYEVIDKDDVAFGLGSENSVDPQQNAFPSAWRDSADEFWYVELPPASGEFDVVNGAELIVDLVKNAPNKVSIIILGGNTDVALALQKDPTMVDKVEKVVIMGGAFERDGNLYEAAGYGNNRDAEWNIFVDPLAASQVFTSGLPIMVVPLDGSDDFYLRQTDIDRISDSDDPILTVLTDLWDRQLKMWGGEAFKIWDLVAAVALTNPELMDWTKDGIDVVTEFGDSHGKTYRLHNGSTLTMYASNTDFDRVYEIVFDVLLSSSSVE